MSSAAILARLQGMIRAAGLDGWLLYDFRGLNPFPAKVLQLGSGILTRRWFLYVPADGRTSLIHHRIESTTWEHLLPTGMVDFIPFASHQQLDAQLQMVLRGARRVAMEYSPRGEVPYVSHVDAGTLERVRATGVDIVSSQDLLQAFLTWNADDVAAHEQAVRGVIHAKALAFAMIDQRMQARAAVTELEVQAVIARELALHGLETDHAAIVAFGSHASDGHYAPRPDTDRTLESGQCVLIDLWAGLRDRPMADITWVGFAGPPTDEYINVWLAVQDARDLAVKLLVDGQATAGWEVDRAARDLITARGYGPQFRHRLGHSLGRNIAHGQSVNLDDWETHDTRRLLPGLGVTVEPGIYLGHLGVRSEVNVLITAGGARMTTPAQNAPIRFG